MMKYEPKVLKLYAKHITGIFDMPRSVQKVLGYIVNAMNDENEITIAAGGKAKMIDDLEMKPQTLNNSLSELVKAGVLGNPAKGFYVANPEIFTYKKKWGETMNQQRKFKAEIRYENNGKTFKIKGMWDNC
jgi:Firmicute plasmid replication protein (RepL)